jgi:hypothetical protein
VKHVSAGPITLPDVHMVSLVNVQVITWIVIVGRLIVCDSNCIKVQFVRRFTTSNVCIGNVPMQELLERCTSIKAEYTKATEMLLEQVNAHKAKDEKVAKLELANTRLQNLCRALRTPGTADGSVASSKQDVSSTLNVAATQEQRAGNEVARREHLVADGALSDASVVTGATPDPAVATGGARLPVDGMAALAAQHEDASALLTERGLAGQQGAEAVLGADSCMSSGELADDESGTLGNAQTAPTPAADNGVVI